ncbi:Sensor kinase CusS [Clostridium sp. N3C]|uniref:HAMP domain-containing sensor histidine kinase n=1 Tax=Clostridium sp. N3C TaxID=1776758 RepID=UPI00092DF6EF|nr:HAMP domain-containing sensor histidine kinase [Clostridium sp. N3C]SCN22768.1 Sensor kinase CusS [Clostridium sp. N3C]
MKRYFTNPELKVSSVILLSIITLFFVINTIVLKMYNDNLKDSYVESIGAITARVVEKNPELKGEIIPMVTKGISREEAEVGKSFLAQYGVTEELENQLFPYVNKASAKNNITGFFVFALMAIIILLFNYVQYGFFYNKIRRLTIGAKKVVEAEYDISINENKEGDFSKLAVAFNSMRATIRNNISQLEKEKQFLADLLSDISHQLKTPLSSMIIYNDIMLSKDLTKEQREKFLLHNENQLNRMNWLIQSMLKLAKIDANAIEFDKLQQSLKETIEEAIDTLTGKAKEQGVNILFQVDNDMLLDHDRLWMEEALINIIKNSIEHTPAEGQIKIDLLENPIYKRIIIEDTGEGISEEDLPNIFKRFYKAKSSKKTDSVGIGLALAKSIIEAHQGIIEVKSKLGAGTRFTITFLKY